MTDLFKQLTKLAQERGLPLTAAADQAGINRTTLWNWRNKLPKTLQTLERLMKVLGDDRANPQPAPPPIRENEKPA